jgi:two-component system, cell cycle sensor histidine kinase and response regulator CckA
MTWTCRSAIGSSIFTGAETLLIVEDEISILNLGRRILEGLGYTVLTALSAKEAISHAETHKRDIKLVLTDVVMPEMNGHELIKKLMLIIPNLKCIYMSGYTANAIAHHGVLGKGVYFIQKPFSLEDVSRKVREALDSINMRKENQKEE